MEIIHGRNLIVSLNGTPIVGARSCEINVSTGEIEISSPSQGTWRDFIAGRKEWTVSTSHLFTPADQFSYSGTYRYLCASINWRDEKQTVKNV